MKKGNEKKAKIGLIQVKCDYSWSIERCQEHLLKLSEECLKEGADLVFMPELFQYKAVCLDTPAMELALKYYSPFYKSCRELAVKYGAYIAPWDYEPAGDAVYNTSYILDRQGNEAGKYRKVHLTIAETDVGLSAGNSFPVFDLDFGKVGIMICFDNYYAESARCLALNGAELILYPLYGDGHKNQWEIKLKARAIDNMVYVAPSPIHSQAVTYTGIVGPFGEVVYKLDEEGSFRVVEIEMQKNVMNFGSDAIGKYMDMRQYLHKIRNTDAYGPIIGMN